MRPPLTVAAGVTVLLFVVGEWEQYRCQLSDQPMRLGFELAGFVIELMEATS